MKNTPSGAWAEVGKRFFDLKKVFSLLKLVFVRNSKIVFYYSNNNKIE